MNNKELLKNEYLKQYRRNMIKNVVIVLKIDFDCLKSCKSDKKLYNIIRSKMVDNITFLSAANIIEKRHFEMLHKIILKNT